MLPPYPLPWLGLQARRGDFLWPRGRLDHRGRAAALGLAGRRDHHRRPVRMGMGVFVIGAAAVLGLVGGQTLQPELALRVGFVLLVAVAGPLAGVGVTLGAVGVLLLLVGLLLALIGLDLALILLLARLIVL